MPTLFYSRNFGLSAKTRIGWVESFFGDDHDTVSRPPKQHLHTLAHTPHSTSKQTLGRRDLGFRGVGELLPRTAGIFLIDVHKMLRFRFWSARTFLEAPAFARYLQRFRTIRPLVVWQLLPRRVCNSSCCRSFGACAFAISPAVTVAEREPLQLLQLSQIGSLSPCILSRPQDHKPKTWVAAASAATSAPWTTPRQPGKAYGLGV